MSSPGMAIAEACNAVDLPCTTCGALRPCDCDEQLGAELYGEDDDLEEDDDAR